MLNNLCSLLNQEGSLSLGEACIYALIGFALIFVGILIIILIIKLIGLLMQKTDNLAFLTSKKKKKKNKAVKSVAASDDVVASDEVPNEIKAAIVAALMAYYTSEKPKCEFKVKRIRRI